MSENLITEAELAQYAPDLDTSGLPSVSGTIATASKMVANYCNVDGFLKTSVTNERDKAYINSEGELIISPRRPTIVQGEIDAIRLVTVDVSQELTLSDGGNTRYFVPSPGNYLIYPSNFLISHGRGLFAFRSGVLLYEMDYTGGYATDIEDLPVDLKEATSLFVRHMSARKYNQQGAQSFSQGRLSINFGSSKDGQDKHLMQASDILARGGYIRRTP